MSIHLGRIPQCSNALLMRDRKCVKSAIFGDADNLWEVLWYPNSGVAGGETASLYLSCVVSLKNVASRQALAS